MRICKSYNIKKSNIFIVQSLHFLNLEVKYKTLEILKQAGLAILSRWLNYKICFKVQNQERFFLLK